MTAPAAAPAPVHEQLALSLYHAETSSYRSLNILDMRSPRWIVSHVQAGEVCTSTRGHAWVARSGDVMIHAPQVPFCECAVGPGTHQWMAFDAAVSPHLDLFRRYPVCPVVSLASPVAYAGAFDALEAAWRDAHAPARDLRVFMLALDLIGRVLDGWRRAGSPPRPDGLETAEDRFAPVVAYMAAHLHEHLSREDLAGLACLHPGYFDRAFRAVYGVPPMRMLRALRLRRAQQMLETTGETLEAVARACGFGDAAHFGRVFRERFGQAPGRYREGAKATREGYIRPL